MVKKKLKIAVVGVGHLGKEHARVYSQLPNTELVGVVDIDEQQGKAVAQRLGTQYFPNLDVLDDKAAAVSVVVPTSAHFEVASHFLNRGIPVLLEKPMAGNIDEAMALVDLGMKTDTLLQVGYIERFNPVIKAVEEYPMTPRFIECHRLSNFNFRAKDTGVILDLMVHDIDIILHLAQSPVKKVEAVGARIISSKEDVANARLTFENGCVANVTASRVSFRPMRKIRLFSENVYISLDYEKQEAIIYKKSPNLTLDSINMQGLNAKSLIDLKDYNFGDQLEVKHIKMENEQEPLKKELESFVDCVLTHGKPRVSGEDGLNALKVATEVLKKAEESWKSMQGV
ncbi:MAG: Gfo/Idh/MocA family oxidoreductase [Candidatus Brocadiales bacterium]|nr:Gfo/Idh/MocA family oxidoreductase [Candidatus Bathyanammoxibius sp.]MCQ4574668.1 Gfo/Idh/MocA family oxidoreductase [Candidatus Bathyanammoxibius amoris]